MPRVVVSKVEELPRELWFGKTGPLERLSLKRSIAKLEAAGLCPSWSDIEPLLSYLRECVSKLGSYARCAAVVGTTRNMIRDACRGRYVPGFDRLLAWGRRLAEHPGGLRGLLLTVDLPVAEVTAWRPAPGVEVRPDVGRQPRNTPPLDVVGYTLGEHVEAWPPRSANTAPPGAHALARDNSTHGRSTSRRPWARRCDDTQSSAMGPPASIRARADACEACGCATPRGVSPPETRANPVFTLGEHPASAHLDAAGATTLGEVSIPAPVSEPDRGVVLISEPVAVGEVLIPAHAPLGEHHKCTHLHLKTLGVVSECEQSGVREHANIEHHPRPGYSHKKSSKKSLRRPPDDPVSVPAMVVAEFRYGGCSTRAGYFDTEEQARRAIDSWLDTKAFEGAPFIDGRPYTRQRTQEQILDELLEKKFQEMRTTQVQDRREQESLILTFLFYFINGVKKHGTVRK